MTHSQGQREHENEKEKESWARTCHRGQATPVVPLSNEISTDYGQAGLGDSPENRGQRSEVKPFSPSLPTMAKSSPITCPSTVDESICVREHVSQGTNSHKAIASCHGINPIPTLGHQHTVVHTTNPTSISLGVPLCFALFCLSVLNGKASSTALDQPLKVSHHLPINLTQSTLGHSQGHSRKARHGAHSPTEEPPLHKELKGVSKAQELPQVTQTAYCGGTC